MPPDQEVNAPEAEDQPTGVDPQTGELLYDKQESPPVEAESDKAETASEQPSGQDSEETFMPPGDVPEGQEAAYKSMQGHFTRSQQVVKAREKELDGMKERVDYVDRLLANPQFRELVDSFNAGQFTPGKTQDETPELPEVSDPEVKSYVDQRLEQVKEASERKIRDLEFKVRAGQFAAGNPDWQKFAPAMQRLWNTPEGRSLDYEHAYKLAKYEEVHAENVRLSERLASLEGVKRKAMRTDPGTVRAAPVEKKQFKSIAESGAAALKQLLSEGYKFPK